MMRTRATMYVWVGLWLVSCVSLQAQPTTWTPQGVGGGGAFFGPSINPHHTDEAFVVSDMTDVFHTMNGGQQWEVVSFTDLRAFSGTKVQFTSDPDHLYALHLDFGPDLTVPVKSTDGGKTWARLPADPTAGEAFYLFADETSTDRLIVTSYCEIFFSADGGQTFRSIYQACAEPSAYVAGIFWDGPSITIATATGLLVSSDGGATFAVTALEGIPASEGLVSFAGAKQGGVTRFFSVTLDRGDIWPGVTGAEYWGYEGIYTRDLGTQRWTRKTGGLEASDRPFFVAMARDNIDIAYVAGGNTETSYPIIFKTTDGGASWNPVFLTAANQNIATGWSGYRGDEDWWYGEYALGFAVARSDPDVALLADLGFVHSTTDGGATWRQRYVDAAGENPAGASTPRRKAYRSIGLENTSAWGLTWVDPDHLIAGYSDIMARRSLDGGGSWAKDFAGPDYNSVYRVLRDPTEGTLYAAAASVHDLYQSHRLKDSPLDAGTGAVLYSIDAGATWQTLHDFGRSVVWIALDPNDSQRLYASVVHSTEGGLFRTDDLDNGPKATWVPLAAPPRTEGHPYNIHVLDDGTLVATYSGRRTGNGFTPSSGVFLSVDGGASWIDRSDAGMHYWTKDLVLDPHDATQNTWYVGVFSGWGGPPNGLGGVYKTTDRGRTWARINDLDRVESVTISPQNPDEMYVTTEYEGLWYTDNLTAPPPTFTFLDAYPFQHPMRVFFDPYDVREVWVTSFGNGLRLGVDETTGVAVETVEPLPAAFSLAPNYPNPFNPSTTIQYDLPVGGSVTLRVYDVLGRALATLVEGIQPAGHHEVRFDAGSLPGGLYLYRLEAGPFSATRTMILVR